MADGADFETQLIAAVREWELALRSGYSVRQMFEQTAREGPEPLRGEVAQMLAEVEQGLALPEVLRRWANRNPSRGLFLVINALLVQRETGGNLADLLQAVGIVLRG